jgi:hypothetical protein
LLTPGLLTRRPALALVSLDAVSYPIATVPPTTEVAPFIKALREAEHRPFRIVSHEDENGRVFNASFYENEETMNKYLAWLSEDVLNPSGKYHSCIAHAADGADGLPTPETLLFGTATQTVADTRFGEYQLGMAVRFTKWEVRSPELFDAAVEGAASTELEQRIAACMQDHGVSYFGRLVMADRNAGKAGHLLSIVRYGSMDDCTRGLAASRELLSSEIKDWFDGQSTLMGIATRVLEV